MPQLETGNWPGNAWCKRPSCPLPRGGAVGAIRGPSERRSLKVANDCSLEKTLPEEVAEQGYFRFAERVSCDARPMSVGKKRASAPTGDGGVWVQAPTQGVQG